ncbi:ferritin-like domain-containing protein [Bailinhaonella thermotolerans]|uniref:DNA protection protein DPS n=1 Tax=Bailinhaonella thermotolerans TaxID=1070861 RepID=A0A3A4BFI2_9ACTN|nr:ferritin-like domain-containing protein [Bailinhaonella thermotolerans]RJL30102.1 DNA protection protein DPS [Bailinhaonella thermotolerans]
MPRAAREAVQRAGLDVDALLAALTAAAQAELSAYYRHTVLAAHSHGLTEAPVRALLADLRAEARAHFEALVTRIAELDGPLPPTLPAFAGPEGRGEGAAPPYGTDEEVLRELTAVVERAVRAYDELRAATERRDPRTHALAAALLAGEREHETWIREARGEPVSPRYHPGFRGASPHLAR